MALLTHHYTRSSRPVTFGRLLLVLAGVPLRAHGHQLLDNYLQYGVVVAVHAALNVKRL